jgi:BASS family bile acid:Na+ symporter
MQSSALTTVGLPVALGIIMLGLGLALTLADFTRVYKMPKAVLVGLGCQMLILPVLCFTLVKVGGLQPELAVGMMLLAASPGGVTANLYSHLAKGDVALNITLTAINSVLSVVSVPLIVNFALAHFAGTEGTVPLQFSKTAQIFVVVLGPVAIGMFLRSRWPAFAEKMNKPVKVTSAILLVLIVLATVLKERANVGSYFQQIGIAALIFNLSSMAVGYAVPRLLKLNKQQSIAIGMEIGIHNATLAIAVAQTLLNNGTMAIPAAVYSVIMFFTAAGFGLLVNRGGKEAPIPATTPAA